MILNDPSAVILIGGAAVIFAFLVHGLWSSGQPRNRKLSRTDAHDQELLHAEDVAKVRIISTNPLSEPGRAARAAEAAAARSPMELRERELSHFATVSAAEVREAVVDIPEGAEWSRSYEINLVAPKDSPFRGEDIEAIANEYGFLYGELNIFYVYENPERRENEVFRICSLKHPFSFPANMDGYTTPAIALYMNLPEKGKGYAYFNAIKMAAEIFSLRLGGVMQDNNHRLITEEQLEQIGQGLLKYDES